MGTVLFWSGFSPSKSRNRRADASKASREGLMRAKRSSGSGRLRGVFFFLLFAMASVVFAQEGPAIRNLGATDAELGGDWLAYTTRETFRGQDLNGDGDIADTVVHARNLATGRTTNLGLAVHVPMSCVVSADELIFEVSEWDQRRDLTGDGCMTTHEVIHAHNLTTGRTANLGLNADVSWRSLSGDWLILRVFDSSQDLDGDGNLHNGVYHLVDLTRLDDLRPYFVRAEANGDGRLDIADGVFILSWLFVDGREPSCLDAADVDDNGRIDISDAVRIFRLLFVGQEPPPPPPGLSCGPDETDDALGCRSFVPCF